MKTLYIDKEGILWHNPDMERPCVKNSNPPYQPFYKPYGMFDEEYDYEVRLAERKLNDWHYEQEVEYAQATERFMAGMVRFEDQRKVRWLLWDDDTIVEPSEYADFETWFPKPGTFIEVDNLPEVEKVWEHRWLDSPDGSWHPGRIENHSVSTKLIYEEQVSLRFKQ